MADFYGKLKEDREKSRERAAAAVSGPRPSYKILTINQLKVVDLQRAAAIASFVRTAEEAANLAGHEGMSYRDMDRHGRFGAVVFNGVEVKYLIKRQITERTPVDCEPIPEKTLKDPDDAWISIDLTQIDEVTKQKSLSEALRNSRDQVIRLQQLWKKEEAEAIRLREELDKVANIRSDLRAANEKLALADEAAKASAREIESLKRDVQRGVQAQRDEKRKTIEELFPVFDTVWLAGVHRVGDQLYGMLRKLLTDGLRRAGIELIEPSSGDEFNPEMHHAVHTTEFEYGAKEINAVVQVHHVGWKLDKGPVFKAAEVTVGVQKPDLPLTQ